MTIPSWQDDGQGPDGRDAFMAPILAALGRSTIQTPGPPPQVDESIARLADATMDLPALFARQAADVGMSVVHTTGSQLFEGIAERLDQLGARSAVIGLSQTAQAAELAGVLSAHGIRVVPWQPDRRFDSQFDTAAGVTDVHAALAETGTLICWTDAHHGRGLSLVPPIHLAIVRRSDILPDMIDFWRLMAGRQMPSSISFITGPSKTADIEGELVTGVHGPGQVHIFLVTDDLRPGHSSLPGTAERADRTGG